MENKNKKRKSLLSRKILKVLIFYPDCFKSTSFVIKLLPEVKPFESSQRLCQNSEFKIIDYLPNPCKISIQNCFWAVNFILYPISKLFAAHVTTNSVLKIGEKIHENAFRGKFQNNMSLDMTKPTK